MTITLTREEAQQVLDALEYNQANWQGKDKAIETLRARLSAPEPEPVAYGVLDDDGQIDWTAEYPFSNEPGWPDSVPLYTAPPQREEGCAECGKKSSDGWALYCVKCSEREWQGLTDEEREEATGWSVEHIEAKLREKNI
jgi:hypothetical protein